MHRVAKHRLAVLTQREREIAGALILNPATARAHLSRAMIKLSARDRAQLVVIAHQTGCTAAGRS